MSQSARPTYSEEQLLRYLQHIGKHERLPKEACDTEAGLTYLNELIPMQLTKVPFENLDLHYSPSKHVSIDAAILFDKVVDRNVNRGGYCMQNNLFFGTILRSLGYKVMPCGSRVSSGVQGVPAALATYTGWSHTVNLVMIAGKKYFVDVGFGNNGPTQAIPIADGWTGRKHWNKEFDDQYLVREHPLDNTFHNEEQKLWVWHVRSSADAEWSPMYCFSEIEFLPQDFHTANFYVSRSLESWFTFTIVCAKFILDDTGRDIGDLTLFNNAIKRRLYGKQETVAEVKSEEERVQALEKYFGIKLNEVEKGGIRNHVTMLRG